MKKIIIPVEVYSRVSGYFRPTTQWNRGKQSEFTERKSLKYILSREDIKITKE